MPLNDYDILGALDDLDIEGDDDELLGALAVANPELLGAARARARARRLPGAPAALRKRFGMRAPGVPAQGARRMPLGFDSFTFVNAGVTSFAFTARPQVPFKGRRLVLDIVRTGAAAIAVRVDDIQVGTKSQMAGVLRITSSIFVPTAFDTDLQMDPCTPGIDIVVVVSLSAGPAVGDNITVTPTLVGDAIQ